MIRKKSDETLSTEASAHVMVSKKRGRDPVQTIKMGVPLDHSPKHSPVIPTSRVVGMNKGVTKNMGDYESFRVDCWISDVIAEDETPEEAYHRLSVIIDKCLQEEIDSVT